MNQMLLAGRDESASDQASEHFAFRIWLLDFVVFDFVETQKP